MRDETNSFSRTFKIAFGILALLYLLAWFGTIHLSQVQRRETMSPVLPVAPQDSEEYAWLAESLAAGQGFSHEGTIETLRAPGYPSFVAAARSVGGSFFAATFLQIFLAFAAALLVRRVGIHFGSRRIGEIAAILLLLNPVTLVLSLVILTDILFLFLFILGFYLSLMLGKAARGDGHEPADPRPLTMRLLAVRSCAIGLVFAAAIYVRPMGFFAIPIFAAGFLVAMLPAKRRLLSLCIMLLAIAAAIAPWMLRNRAETGVFGFTSFQGINLAYYAAPMFLAHRDGLPLQAERAAIEASAGIPIAQWRDIRYSDRLSDVSKRIILAQPFAYAEYHLQSSLPFLFSSTLGYAADKYDSVMHAPIPSEGSAMHELLARNWKGFAAAVSASWWKLAERILWVLIYLLALWGLILKRHHGWAWICVLIPAYLMALAGPAADARYALPALPFIAFLFAAGLGSLFPREKKDEGPKKNKVLFLINSLGIGGAERVFIKTANSLSRSGTDVHFALLFGDTTDQPLLGELALPAEKIFYAGARSFHDLKAIRLLAHYATENGIGTIYSTLNESNIVARILGILLPVRVIIREANVADRKPLSFRLLDIGLNLFAHTIVCVSEEVRKSLKKYQPFYAHKMEVVMNGVDIPPQGKVYDGGSSPVRILNVGSLTPKKGQRYLIEACAALRESLKGQPETFELSIVGSGSEEGSLRRLIADKGLEGRVKILPPLSSEKLSELYLQSDIFVLSSLWEGCPNVLLEAMAHGLACISADVSGAPSIIEDGVSGKIVPRGDSEAMAEALSELIRHPDKRAGYGKTGRQKMGEEFSNEMYLNKVRSILLAH